MTQLSPNNARLFGALLWFQCKKWAGRSKKIKKHGVEKANANCRKHLHRTKKAKKYRIIVPSFWNSGLSFILPIFLKTNTENKESRRQSSINLSNTCKFFKFQLLLSLFIFCFNHLTRSELKLFDFYFYLIFRYHYYFFIIYEMICVKFVEIRVALHHNLINFVKNDQKF